MLICLLLERGTPPRLNPIVVDLIQRLERRGAAVTIWYPEQDLIRLDTLAITADLYLLKSDTELALSLANALEGMGARILNRARASSVVREKPTVAARLLAEGLPVPRSWIAERPAALAPMLERGSLILKPHRGYHGAGVLVAPNAAALPPAETYPEILFAQAYLGGSVRDLKLFVVGEQVFAVRRKFAQDSFLDAGTPIALSPELEVLARRCGEIFGLELYGIDVLEVDGTYYVVDVNYFPGYRGVPNAAGVLADYIFNSLGG